MEHTLNKYYNYVVDLSGNLVQGLTIPIQYAKKINDETNVGKNKFLKGYINTDVNVKK